MTNDAILTDIFANHRTFLPGKRCSENEVIEHLERAILIDGLNREEAQLILSTLPAKANRIYLTPLDKGLSGSKVFSAKFDVDSRLVSKLFVFKLGNKQKIDNEYNAIEQFVTPHIHGIGQPVYRVGNNSALIVQELAGLASTTSLLSLKNYIRIANNPEKVIIRLLNERLGSWYLPKKRSLYNEHNLGSLFQYYLTKVSGDICPPEWSELNDWVKDITGDEWGDISSIISKIKTLPMSSRSTTVHGDLHSQNVLIDEREECWPIDFAWCHDNSSPLLDFTMLECSLKFLAIPQHSDLVTLIRLEKRLSSEPFPNIVIGRVPYSKEISNVVLGVLAVRKFAIDTLGASFDDYRRCLCLMTYSHSTNPKLNLPYVIASLQILTSVEENYV